MKINFLEKKDEKSWNQFLFQNKGSFLQSFEWGEFQKKLSKKVWRIVIRDNNQTLAQAQIIKEIFPFNIKSNFYIPFGPCFKEGLSSEKQKLILEQILKELHKLSKKEKAIFLRIEPLSDFSLPNTFPSKISLKRLQPQKTLILDLEKSEQKIFDNFSQKVRYNIRLAKKKGVSVEVHDKYLPEFYSLMEKTSKRDSFQPFSEKHYKKLFSCASRDFKVKLFLAKYKDKIIASYILILFGSRAICLHGASDWEYRSLKAPNLAQWERIRKAKDMGAREIDFWGIDENKWPGLTAFKKGFRGKEVEYPQGRDIIFKEKWYSVYQFLRKVK